MKPVGPVQLSSGSGSESFELVLIEHLPEAACAVPVRHLAFRFPAFEQLEDVRPQRRHARSAADVDHLVVRLFDEEVPKGAGHGHFVTGLQAEDVRRTFTRRRTFRSPGRRRRDPHIEHDDAFFVRIIRHRIGALDRFGRVRLQPPQVVAVPVRTILLVDVEVGKLDVVRRTVHLDVLARLEVHLFARRQIEHRLLDERRHVSIGAHRTDPATRLERFGRHFDFHVLLHGDLTGQPISQLRFAIRDVSALGRQQFTTATKNPHATLPAGSRPAARGRHINPLVGKHIQQLRSR